MILFFYDVTWPCDGDCNISVLCDNCHILLQHLVPSIFKKREKKEKDIR